MLPYKSVSVRDRGSAQLPSPRGHDLLVDGATVRWTYHGQTLRKYTFDEPVRFAKFADFAGRRAAVMILKNLAHVYLQTGQPYIVSLPVQVSAVFASKVGLVLARQSDSVLLSLVDPLMELGLVMPSSSTRPSEQLIFLSAQSMLAMTIDRTDKSLCVYQVKYLSPKPRDQGLSTRQRRSSKRKSTNLEDRPEPGRRHSADSRLSFSRTSEALPLDRSIADNHLGGLDPRSMRKDMVLTHVKTVYYDQEPTKIRACVNDDKELIVVLNGHTLTLLPFTQGQADFDGDRGILAKEEVCDFEQVDSQTMLLLSPSGQLTLANFLVQIESPPIDCGPVSRIVKVAENWATVVLQDGLHLDQKDPKQPQVEAPSRSVTLQLVPEPDTSATALALSSMGLVLDAAALVNFRYVWATNTSLGHWRAYLATVLLMLLNDTQVPTTTQSLLDPVLAFVAGKQTPFSFEGDNAQQYVVLCVHNLYEEMRLDVTYEWFVPELECFLSFVAFHCRWSDSWTQYYGAHHQWSDNYRIAIEQPLPDPPSIFRSISSLLAGDAVQYKTVSQLIDNGGGDLEQTVLKNTMLVSQIFDDLFLYDGEPEPAFGTLCANNLTHDDIERLPEGLRAIVVEIIGQVKEYDMAGSQALKLLSRPDLQAQAETGSHHNILMPPSQLRTELEADRIQVSKLLFGDDRRIYEVSTLLQTSRVQEAILRPQRGQSEADIHRAQQELSKITALRTMSLPLGRAALLFSGKMPLMTEKYPVPRINFTIVIKPDNVTISHQKSDFNEQYLVGGFFHNGVSAGLSVSRDTKNMTANWVVFNKPPPSSLPSLSAHHGGFLLGLGINGHLKEIEEWHIYNYLGPKFTPISIGLLMGMAASRLGSEDQMITKVVSVHVMALLPPGSHDLNVDYPTQTAGIISIGLLYFGRRHLQMSDLLLSEIDISRRTRPVHERVDDPNLGDGYLLACGMALGMINLASGRSDPENTPVTRHGASDSWSDRLIELATRLQDVETAQMLGRSVAGAMMALMLMFLQSETESVAKKIALPPWNQLTEYLRPDHIVLRVLCYNMIMWQQIGRDNDWIMDQMPTELVHMVEASHRLALDSDHAIYLNVLTALALSMGLKHASTADLQVRDQLLVHLDRVITLCDYGAMSHEQHMARKSALVAQSTLSLSLASVMVGTGDLEVFRRLRVVYSRTRRDVTFGNMLANQLAMGLLFLGGGQYALDTSPRALAFLLIAFYPVFPVTLRDNRWHLQALRHFWAFAAENRCFVARDVVSRRPVKVDVDIGLASGEVVRCQLPALGPSLESVRYIVVKSPEFFEHRVDVSTSKIIYVSRRPVQPGLSLDALLVPEEKTRHWLLELEPELEKPGVALRQTLRAMAKDPSQDDLWNLRILLQFGERYRTGSRAFLALIDELHELVWRRVSNVDV